MAADTINKRRNITSKAMAAATRFLDALRELEGLAEERQKAGNFVDADFEGTDLRHVTPALAGTLLDIVVLGLVTAVEDAANDGRAKNILLEIRA